MLLPMQVDLGELKQWVGNTEMLEDCVTPTAYRALNAALDRAEREPQLGDLLAPSGHWLYFLQTTLQSNLDLDGHARRGAFLPPVPLPRRMWAGSRIEFLQPLKVGQKITRTSRIMDVSSKEGQSGALVFVRVRHEISATNGPALIEDQDIVYRGAPILGERSVQSPAAPLAHEWSRDVKPDEVLLFRYSALTFNSHRIHYDRPYATKIEGYPGLVVQAPLIATLLLDLLRRNMPEAEILRFAFRAVKPTFDSSPLSLRGGHGEGAKTVRLWAQDIDGLLSMDATATVA